MEQYMADLPEDRVTPQRPFEVCGTDFCGPFKIRRGKSTRGRTNEVVNAHLCIFVDFPTTAVHLELTGDLTTASFLAALDRFTSRRGRVRKMYSDNGPNYNGAVRVLERNSDEWNETEIKSELAVRGIEWIKHCPYRSHASGIWESVVKRCKYFVRRVILSDQMTFEELYTVFVKIEGLLNSRPLGRQRDQANEDPMITPGHFLIGEAISHPLGPRVYELPNNRLDAWERVHKVEQCWWNAWYEDHLMELQKRAKWAKQYPNVRVGDLVLLIEPGQPPASWPRAKVAKIYPSQDGRVRTVQVRTGFPNIKLYDRPITKLCPLPDAVYEKLVPACDEEKEEQEEHLDDE